MSSFQVAPRRRRVAAKSFAKIKRLSPINFCNPSTSAMRLSTRAHILFAQPGQCSCMYRGSAGAYTCTFCVTRDGVVCERLSTLGDLRVEDSPSASIDPRRRARPSLPILCRSPAHRTSLVSVDPRVPYTFFASCTLPVTGSCLHQLTHHVPFSYRPISRIPLP